MSYQFSALSFSDNEPLPRPRLSAAMAGSVMRRAFADLLLPARGDRSWYEIPSVRKAFIYQAMLLGAVRRNHGGISFLTHLMEVTDGVFNCPELIDCNREKRAFVAAGHDLEDIVKERGLSPNFVLATVMEFLSPRLQIDAGIRNDLFMLMDPPTMEGDERRDLQTVRAAQMDMIPVYTRYFDKLTTYRRDLHNMRTVDSATGLPYLHFDDERDANAAIARMLGKGVVVEALPVPDKYKKAWYNLVADIRREIDRQLDPAADSLMPAPVRPPAGRRSFTAAPAA